MASGTFVLRPSSDISLNHSTFMSGGHSGYPGYLCINEEVSDGASSYIQVKTLGVGSATSKFGLSNMTPTTGNPFVVTGVNILGDPFCSAATGVAKNAFALEINGTETETFYVESDKNIDISISDSGVIDLINEFVAVNGVLPDINIIITSYRYEDTSSDKGGTNNSGVSQIYVAVHYEEILDIGIHHKVNGSWVAAMAAYQKQSGSWVEITEDEAKSILQNSFCIKQTIEE